MWVWPQDPVGRQLLQRRDQHLFANAVDESAQFTESTRPVGGQLPHDQRFPFAANYRPGGLQPRTITWLRHPIRSLTTR
jgi:hypothetical protein